MSDLYRVPKHEVPAEVTILGLPTERMTLYLSERAETHSGGERPSDLLNAPFPFFAARESSGKIVLLRREMVLVVSVDAELELGGDAPPAESLASERATRAKVEAVLEGGGVVRGMLSYLMPEGRGRLQDFLEECPLFVGLRDSRSVRLINTRRILRIVALPT